MKAKTKIILSSCMTIAMAASLIAGATLAIFTSESKTNIAVNTGKVKVVAMAEITNIWSAEWRDSGYENHYITNDGDGYIFTNGGTVFYNDSTNEISLNNVTPGDGAEISIGIKNYSNVLTKYRIEVSRTDDTGLYDGLKISYAMTDSNGDPVDGFEFKEGKDMIYTDWNSLDISSDPENGEDVGDLTVSIELPVGAGNQYQETSCKIAINVFAVQWNGHVEDPEAPEPDDAVISLDSDLLAEVLQVAEENGYSTDAIVFGVRDTYFNMYSLSSDWETGVRLSQNGARVFYDAEGIEGYDGTLYVLATGSAVVPEDTSDLVFEDTNFRYADLSGVDFSDATSVSNMFKNSQIETLIMQGVNLSKATDLEGMFSGCEKNLKNVDFSGADLSKLTKIWSEFAAKENGANSVIAPALQTVNFSGANLSGLTTLENAFAYDVNLTSANFSGANLSNVEKMGAMFLSCTRLEMADFSGTNLSELTTMHAEMSGGVNVDIVGSVDSNVEEVIGGSNSSGGSSATVPVGAFAYCFQKVDFSEKDFPVTFCGATFGKLEDLSWMFRDCYTLTHFNFSEVFGDCNLTTVTDISNMFYIDAGQYESKLTSIDFAGAHLPNADMMAIFKSSNIESANFAGATISDPVGMFQFVYSLKNIDFADATIIGSAEGMFQFCDGIETVSFVGANLSGLTNMKNMFNNCTALTEVIFTGADLSSVTNIEGIFSGCSQLASVDFNGLDLSGVDNMSKMFYDCTSLISADFTGVDLSGVTGEYGDLDTGLANMFYGCTNLKSADFSGANLKNVKTVTQMFLNSGIISANFSGTNLESIEYFDMFRNCSSLISVDFSGAWLSSVKSLSTAFKTDYTPILQTVNFSDAHFESVTTTNWMFFNIATLDSVDFSDADLSGVVHNGGTYTGVYQMFYGCSNLKTVNFSNVDLSSLTSISSWFGSCTSFETINLSGAKLPQVTSASSLFSGLSNLTTVYLWRNEDLEKLTNTSSMFNNCSKLENIYVEADIDLSVAGGGNISNSTTMFTACTKLPGFNEASNQQYAQHAKTGTDGYFEVDPRPKAE